MIWFVFALVLGIALYGLVTWLRSRDIQLKWYEWLVGGIGLVLLLLAIQHYVGSVQEMYSTAGWMGALIIGVPAIILIALAWQLTWRRTRS
jgi:hypothetical protein